MTSILNVHENVKVLQPADVMKTLDSINNADAVILDPWYNRGVGGTIPNYDEWLAGGGGQVVPSCPACIRLGVPGNSVSRP